MSTSCSHIDTIQFDELPRAIAGCEECLASGSWWLHLRMYQTCGHIGCCDSSPNRHANARARETRHQIVRSAEPGEEWSYCYVDNLAFVFTR